MSILTSIKSFLEHAEVEVSAAFSKIFGSATAESFAASAEGLLKSALGQIALTAVQDAATATTLTGAEKKAQAFSNIASAAKSAGIDASDSIINLAIETAVQKVQGSFGPNATAAATGTASGDGTASSESAPVPTATQEAPASAPSPATADPMADAIAKSSLGS